MPSSSIINPVDVLEYDCLCLPQGYPFLPPDQFGLQYFEKRFDVGVIITIAFTAHRCPETVDLQRLLMSVTTILTALIRMKMQSGDGFRKRRPYPAP